MNENFKKQIADIDDLTQIAEILSNSTELKERISTFQKMPYDNLLCRENYTIGMHFQKKGDTIYLLGDYKNNEEDNSSTIEVVMDAIEKKLIESALIVGCSGLFCALIEASAIKSLGFDITSDSELCEKEFLFGDKSKAILVSVVGIKESEFVDYIYNNGINIMLLGHITKGELRLDDLSFGYIDDFLDR